jgi:hypothetical protein
LVVCRLDCPVVFSLASHCVVIFAIAVFGFAFVAVVPVPLLVAVAAAAVVELFLSYGSYCTLYHPFYSSTTHGF